MKKINLKVCGGVFLIIVVIVMIVIPFVIHFYSPDISSEITADGLLDYLGNCIVAIPTIAIASLAIWQTNKANKLAEKANEVAVESDEISRRANDIAEGAMKLAEESNRRIDVANDLAKTANEIAEKSNKIAEIALKLTEEANGRAEIANNLTEKSNDISKKLLELEELRQRLELRPSFAIINWRAPVKKFETVSMFSKDLNVQVGNYSDGIAWGIELELLNTASGFETICYNKAIDENGKSVWLNTMVGMNSRKIELAPLETAKIYFYADKTFWRSQEYKKITVDFYVNNRLDHPYRERFELIIISMTDEVVHKDNEVYLMLEIQNYNVGEYVNKCDEYPDGVIWER